MGRRKRLYKITPKKNIRIGNPGFYEILDKYSRIKLIVPYEHRVIGKRLTVEEALIRAVKTKNIRIIIVSLELFNHIENWRLLSKLAEEEKLERFVGALYDAARTIIKVRRMDKCILDTQQICGNASKNTTTANLTTQKNIYLMK